MFTVGMCDYTGGGEKKDGAGTRAALVSWTRTSYIGNLLKNLGNRYSIYPEKTGYQGKLQLSRSALMQ